MTNIVSKLKGGAAAVFVAAAAALPGGLAMADDAPTVTNASVVQTPVPIRDARGLEERGVRLSAAVVSDEAQVIIYFGDDANVFAALREGARDVIADGELPLRGIIIADPNEDVSVGQYDIASAQQVVVYTDGLRTTTIDSPDAALIRNEIVKVLKDDHERTFDLAAAPSLDQG